MSSVTCQSCGKSIDLDKWKQDTYLESSGKKEVNCPNCGDLLSVQFYCNECDSLYGGRSALKTRGGNPQTHHCPNCEGLLRKGPILDKTQNP